jgi:hypothetical protein
LKIVSTVIAVLALLLCSTAQNPPAQSSAPTARTDVYHVHIAKAAVGKAAQLGDALKTQLPNAPMPGHFIVLRHQQGDEWDYLVIEHLGTKATVEAAGSPTPPAVRDLYAWHGDTFVSGPSWAEFTRAMGLSPDAFGKTASSVYVVAVYNAAPGQRDQLEKFISAPPPPTASSVPQGERVILQHLEGAPWNYLTVTRFNSWQDFATNQASSVADTQKTPGQGGWYDLRSFAAFHRDTLTDRMAPAAAATK